MCCFAPHKQGFEEVAELLTHADVSTTAEYYADWVKARLEKMEGNLVDAYRSAGLAVSTSAYLEPARQVDTVIAEFVAGLDRTGRIRAEESQEAIQIVNRLFASNHSDNWKQLQTNPGRERRVPGPTVQATFEVAPGAWTIGWISGTRTQGARSCEL